jgi:hypothetical protein
MLEFWHWPDYEGIEIIRDVSSGGTKIRFCPRFEFGTVFCPYGVYALFPPPALPGINGTTSLSATPYGPACSSRSSG